MTIKKALETIGKVKVKEKYDLDVKTSYYFVEQILKAPEDTNNLLSVIYYVFKFGYAMGLEAAKKDK